MSVHVGDTRGPISTGRIYRNTEDAKPFQNYLAELNPVGLSTTDKLIQRDRQTCNKQQKWGKITWN